MCSTKISIIVPIYNVEQYLQKTIESCINQTLKELEVILVDDGSKDASGKVVDDFGNMTFMYVLNIDNRYFFSRNVIIKPEDVHTSNDAKKYF